MQEETPSLSCEEGTTYLWSRIPHICCEGRKVLANCIQVLYDLEREREKGEKETCSFTPTHQFMKNITKVLPYLDYLKLSSLAVS